MESSNVATRRSGEIHTSMCESADDGQQDEDEDASGVFLEAEDEEETNEEDEVEQFEDVEQVAALQAEDNATAPNQSTVDRRLGNLEYILQNWDAQDVLGGEDEDEHGFELQQKYVDE